MRARQLLIVGVGLLGAVVALSASYALRAINLRHGAAPVAGSRHLMAFGSRSAAQLASPSSRKLDAALAELSRLAPAARPDHALTDLHNMNLAARFRQASAGSPPEILIDAVTRGDPQALKAALVALGLEHPAVFSNDVGGWLPVDQIEAAAARDEVLSLRASMPHRRAAVATQGDFAQRSDVVRSNYPSLTGSGVTVGVLSDSFDCYSAYAAPGSGVRASGNQGYAYNGFTATYADDQASGALPAGVNVLGEPFNSNCLSYGAPVQTPFTDEGRAMLQIVHVVAPGASLAFRTGDNSEADFATGVTTLAAAKPAGAGANIIADDLGYFDEPFYQDGIVAQAIDAVVSSGVAYFSAAGNNGNASYENTTAAFGPAVVGTGLPNAEEKLLNFDTSGKTTTTTLPITITPQAPGQFLAVVVEWDQPYITGAPNSGGATSQIDVCVTGTSTALGEYLIENYAGKTTACTGANATGTDPVQVLIIGNPADTTQNPSDNNYTLQETLNIQVGLANGTKAPGRIIVSVETDGQTSPEPISSPFATNSETIQGHPGAAGAAAVAAAFYFDTPQCGTTPAQLEAYSSLGGAPILFDSTGARLATPVLRQKPNFVGPDGVNNTFLGFTLANGGITVNTSIAQCQNNASYPNFFGTSAATPHAAGIAALMLQANSTLTPAQIYTALETSALPIGAVPTTGAGANPTYNFNSGYGFIQADAALVAPALSFGSNPVAVNGSTTLTWATANAESCAASGAWSGPQAANGSIPITPTVAGTSTYTLTCMNAFGASASNSVTLTAETAPAAPTLSLSANSIAAGSSVTVTWSSTNATGCTASGSWGGTLGPNSSIIETPSTVGTDTYSLACSN
ncbi:MAG TPA: S8 family serine peptidase, partial [Steroidobacteraceae bacterium]|nr:S8 family serine peptidase [Steroidobacteraceae bacterium]